MEHKSFGTNKYLCIFDKEQDCPVKEAYKLTPESLGEFCKICGHSSAKQRDTKIFEMLTQVASQIISVVMGSQKEKEQLQFQLGKMTATAEMLQARLTESKEKL